MGFAPLPQSRWKMGEPPLGITAWCLIENPSDGEPYLIETEATETGVGVAVELFDGPRKNYLPPHHTIIAWRRK